MKIYPRGWLMARWISDDTFGFYVMLVIHSDADPVVPLADVRRFAKRKRRRLTRELVSAELATEGTDGGLVLAEAQPADGRWRYFGSHREGRPFIAVARAESPNRAPLPPRIKQEVLARDGRSCGICGGEVLASEGLDIDHVIPLARGGTDDLENLQVAHASCNRSKGARLSGELE